MEPFLADTVIAQYFKCFGYGYQARVCKNKAVCGVCGGQHERRTCSIPEQLLKPRCCNCQGSHLAWASICPKHQEAAKKAREAWISRLGKYEIPSSTLSTPAPQLPSTSFSLSHTLPGGKRCKTAELSWFWPSCTPGTSHAPCWKVPSALFPCLLQQLPLPDDSAPSQPPIRTSCYSQLLLFFLLSFFLIFHLANSTKSQVRSCSMSSSGLVSNHIHGHYLSLPI